MGQGASFTIGKKTKTDIQSDPVVLKNIKFKDDLIKESKAITLMNGYCLEKSNLNREQEDRPITPSSIILKERSHKERFVSGNRRSPKHHGSCYGPNDEEEVYKGRFKKEITVLDNEPQQLKEDNGLLDLSSSYVQNGDEREYKESYDKKITSLEIEVQQVKEEKKRMMASSGKKSGGSRKLKKDYKKRIKILEAEVQQLKEEKHKLFTRLSEMGAVRLTENNPNIADLSDDNRPAKLAEQISELYDNEWTDAFEYLTQIEGLQDEATVRQLLNILQTIYTVCLESTKKQADDLKNAMLCYTGLPGETNNDFILKEVLKRLRECRATQFKSILGGIVQDARDQFIDQLECKDCCLLDKYIQKCAHVCWFMCIKDPQMYLDFGQSKLNGTPDDAADEFLLHFDVTKFVSYTQAGMYVEYVVWPAVYLYMNGPIVKRGVAQGLNREPESTESTVKKKGENSNNKGDTINVHAEQGYNAVNSNSDILKCDDGDGCISHNAPGTDDMAQETVKENAQNLKPDSNQHDDLSDAEHCHVSNVNTEVTNSDGNDGYARLSHASNESMEDENVLCQD